MKPILPIASILSLAAISCSVPAETSSSTSAAATESPSNPSAAAREQGAPPVLRELAGGVIEVKFENGCVVLFDKNGELTSGGRLCDDVDLHRARQAAKAHIAEKNADYSDV